MNNGSEIRIGGKLLAENLTGFQTPQFFAIEDQLKQLIYEAVKHNCSDIILQPYQPALMLKSNRLLALTNRELLPLFLGLPAGRPQFRIFPKVFRSTPVMKSLTGPEPGMRVAISCVLLSASISPAYLQEAETVTRL